MKLRFYQEDAEVAVREKFRTVSAIILVLATGAGKTVIFSDVARKAAALGKRVLILAHRDMLLKQASAKLTAYGVEHGLIMSAYTPMLYHPVQVASVQTLVRRLDKIKKGFDLLIVDEAHLSAAPSYLKIVEHLSGLNPKMKILGVTATPSRLDGKGLGRHAGGVFDDMVVGISFKELIAHRFLLRPVVYAPSNQIDLSGVHKKGADYDSEELASVMDKPVITGSAIDHWKRICPGVPAVAWCANITHAQHVADEFNAAGIPARALSGENDGAERDKALRDLEKGRLKVITFAMLLVEGVDCPAIGCVILLRPSLSLVSYLQTIGRGSRPIYADGYDLETIEGRHAAMLAGPKGDHFYVLDHAGLTFRHGFADDERDWDLEGSKKGKKKRKSDEQTIDLKQCPKCFLVSEPAPCCPGCGYVYPTNQRRSAEQVEGELQEITPEMRAALATQQRRDQGRAQTVEDMVEKLGYSRGRAEKIVQAREEKAELRDGLIDDLQRWRERTGHAVLDVFGVPMSAIRTMKPKALRELRTRVDAHFATLPHIEDAPGDDKAFGDYLRRTLGARASEQQTSLDIE